MRLFLVRHGKPEIVKGDFYRCHLGKEGIAGVESFISSGKIPKPDAIFSSPYNRALDTAKVFSGKFGEVKVIVLEGLREWDLQSLNLPNAEYSEEERAGWADFSKKVSGGESLLDVKRRFSECVRGIAREFGSARNILIVSHGTAIDLFSSEISGRPARISDIEKMRHLDYSVADFEPARGFRLVKDILK